VHSWHSVLLSLEQNALPIAAPAAAEGRISLSFQPKTVCAQSICAASWPVLLLRPARCLAARASAVRAAKLSRSVFAVVVGFLG
jgi:hypothetical protein